MGTDGYLRLVRFEEMLRENYDLNRELRFPFGNQYGWGFRYSHRKNLLLYAFIQEEGVYCTISINDRGAENIDTMLLDTLRTETKILWENRYPCGKKGGWFNCSVTNDKELLDLVMLVGVKVKPVRGTKCI